MRKQWGRVLLLLSVPWVTGSCGVLAVSAHDSAQPVAHRDADASGTTTSVFVSSNPSSAPLPSDSLNRCEPAPSPTPDHASSGATEAAREKLGPCINTAHTEALPRFGSGSKLYFLRAGSPENVGGASSGEDVWYAERGEDGGWRVARNAGPSLNTTLNEFVVAASPEGEWLLVGNANQADGTARAGFSIRRRVGAGWSRPEPLEIENWYSRSRWVSASLSADGGVLVLHAERGDGLGATDLYVSFRGDSGSWSEPLNLGPDVNTAGHEITPFLAADGETLYFSTDARGGFGGHDVFVTRRLDSSWQRWSEPENLGERFNSPGFDAYFVVAPDGEHGYLASTSGAMGGTDLFRVPMREPAPLVVAAEPLLLVRGRVVDEETRQPIVGARVVYRSASDTTVFGETRTGDGTGAFELTLPEAGEYTIEAEADRYLGAGVGLEAWRDESAAETVHEVDLELLPAREGARIVLRHVYFDFASAGLRPESGPELERIVRFLRDNPSVRVEVEGHTDSVGSAAANDRLSTSRAQSVRSYLIDRGIEPARVEARGYGSRRPVAANDTEEGRQLNRRVELRVLDGGHD